MLPVSRLCNVRLNLVSLVDGRGVDDKFLGRRTVTTTAWHDCVRQAAAERDHEVAGRRLGHGHGGPHAADLVGKGIECCWDGRRIGGGSRVDEGVGLAPLKVKLNVVRMEGVLVRVICCTFSLRRGPLVRVGVVDDQVALSDDGLAGVGILAENDARCRRHFWRACRCADRFGIGRIGARSRCVPRPYGPWGDAAQALQILVADHFGWSLEPGLQNDRPVPEFFAADGDAWCRCLRSDCPGRTEPCRGRRCLLLKMLVASFRLRECTRAHRQIAAERLPGAGGGAAV